MALDYESIEKPYLEMTSVYADPVGDTAAVVTNEDKVDVGELESYLEEKGVSSDVKSDALNGAKSINYLSDVMRMLENRGEFSILDKYLEKIGYGGLNKPEYKVSSGKDSNVVAYTDTENMIGVGLEFEKRVNEMIRNSGLSKDMAEYYVVAHELIHLAQPKSKLGDTYTAESDADLKLAYFFIDRAGSSVDKNEKESYLNAGKYAVARCSGLLDSKNSWLN